MNTILYPEKSRWEALCKRPGIKKSDLESAVKGIIDGVRKDGDDALLYYSEKYDGVKLDSLKVSVNEINEGVSQVSDDGAWCLNLILKSIE